MSLKFNPKRNHGVITGHAFASFEQDGILFDAHGNSIDNEPLYKKTTLKLKHNDSGVSEPLSNAKAFLQSILAGGPVDKASVFKESENNNQTWSQVTKAFIEMHGITFKRGSTMLWQLPAEELA